MSCCLFSSHGQSRRERVLGRDSSPKNAQSRASLDDPVSPNGQPGRAVNDNEFARGIGTFLTVLG